MSRMIRQQRKSLTLINELQRKRPHVFGWTGPKSFGRLVQQKRFDFFRNQVFFDNNPLSVLQWAIGHVEYWWARVEYALDATVCVIWHRVGGYALDKQIPLSLSRKTTLLSKAFKRFPELAPFKEQGLDILSRAKALSNKRHDLTHGIPLTLKPVGEVFPFSKIDFDNPFAHNVRNFNFDHRDFPALSKSLQDLALEAGDFAMLLDAAFPLRQQ